MDEQGAVQGTYFSHWSYTMYCQCPYRYKLWFIDKVARDRSQEDRGYDIKGSVPHQLAEKFFRIPIEQRKVEMIREWFGPEFDSFVANHTIDYELHGPVEGLRRETERCTVALMTILLSTGLHEADVDTELQFTEQVAPDLKIGGKIDLVVHHDRASKIVDLWDIKAARSVDLQQLYFYGAALKNQGFFIRKSGFLLLREGRIRNSVLLDAGYSKVFSALRDCGQRIRAGTFPAIYNRFFCSRCEVRGFCDQYRNYGSAGNCSLPSGKVPF